MSKSSTSARETNDETELVKFVLESKDSTSVVTTTLRTDERVIARVTDGIYRQPASSLRELISNAYDADAKRVVVKTDAPRFERISIEDDGNGMTPEALGHVLFHIGGTAKRSSEGLQLGITKKGDTSRSPGGRKLIGKIGIGLFSVSQLTSSFQIITKVQGDRFRTIATVVLRHYADEDVSSEKTKRRKFESGKVNIWREKATDVNAHGTTIVLTNIHPQARDTLRSREIWAAIEQAEKNPNQDEYASLEPPQYHIGRVDQTGKLLKKTGESYASVPWESGDDPDESFQKLVECVWNEVELSNPNPQLERIFDYYLRMVWQLSLSIPLPYINGHVFDRTVSGWADAFVLSNQPRGSAEGLKGSKSTTIRTSLQLVDPEDDGNEFDVYFDDLKLHRPIKFDDLPMTSHALKKPIVFIGKCKQTFDKVPHELSGGPLSFEAYLLWTPKVAPTEHRGALIRIHGSSGTLFDPSFMRYQVSELTRLRQIVCEIFVHEGLEGALNIDRESFNNAHPHAVYITKWLHSALRQLATTQKRLASEARHEAQSAVQRGSLSNINRIAADTWTEETGDSASEPPEVELNESGKRAGKGKETYVYSRSTVIRKPSTKRSKKEDVLEEKLKAITKVLASFGLLDQISKRKQERLLRAIYEILETDE